MTQCIRGYVNWFYIRVSVIPDNLSLIRSFTSFKSKFRTNEIVNNQPLESFNKSQRFWVKEVIYLLTLLYVTKTRFRILTGIHIVFYILSSLNYTP